MASVSHAPPIVTTIDAMKGLSLIELAYAVDLVVIGEIRIEEVESPGRDEPGDPKEKRSKCQKGR